MSQYFFQTMKKLKSAPMKIKADDDTDRSLNEYQYTLIYAALCIMMQVTHYVLFQ